MTKEEAKQLLPIIQAYAEGKTIQTRYSFGENMEITWKDVEDPTFTSAGYYRIKPESTYRPFADGEECWNEMQKHQPFGWVIRNGELKILICEVLSFGVVLHYHSGTCYAFDEANKLLVFADGEPFGVKEEV